MNELLDPVKSSESFSYSFLVISGEILIDEVDEIRFILEQKFRDHFLPLDSSNFAKCNAY